ncbi:unnamed protein product, partial [marine sediment metagenome]
MVTNVYRIAGKAEDVVHPSRPGEEEVRLNCHAIPVSAGDLKYRLPT